MMMMTAHYATLNSEVNTYEQDLIDDDINSIISDEVQRDSGNSSHCSSDISSCTTDSSTSSAIKIKKTKEDKNKVNQIDENNESDEDEDDNDEDDDDDNEEVNLVEQSKYFKLNKAPVDVNLLGDERTIRNLLHMEDFYRVHSNYFAYVQTEVKPWMRKMLASWMLEVCKNQSREDDVFVLAMNILDRFLSVQPIGKRHLQLLGTVCMFIAAKLRSAVQFNAETLVIYTANSITIEELLNWEQFVLQKLKWDICSVTPYDFLPYLLNKLNLIEHKNIGNIRQYLSSFIAACATDFKFSMLPSSMIASGCLFATIKSLNTLTQFQCEQILLDIHTITGIDLECLRECVEQIEELIEANLKIKFQKISTTATTIVGKAHHLVENTDENDSMNVVNQEDEFNSYQSTPSHN
jgi:G1/S-specific cyclin-D2